MNKFFKISITIIIIIIISHFGRKYFFPNDKDLIKKHLKELSVNLSYDEKPTPLEILKKSNKLADFFTPSVTFKYNNTINIISPVENRNELIKKTAAIFSKVNKLKIEIDKIKTSIKEENAIAELTGNVKWLSDIATEFQTDELDLLIKLRKDKIWLISHIEKNDNQN